MSGPRRPLEVLVVDDSAVVRQVLSKILESGGMAPVVAANAAIALDRMKRHRPDVIVLDIEMPGMDGLTLLRKIMLEDPIPVVMCSAVAGSGTQTALQALHDGAVDIITKPALGVGEFLEESAERFLDVVRAASLARVRRRAPGLRPAEPKLTADAVLPAPTVKGTGAGTGTLVAIGASTGGTEALRAILGPMPADAPGIVIVQHMAEGFTAAFARSVNAMCRMDVREARDGDPVGPGVALIAPGNRHLVVHRRGDSYEAELLDGPLVSRHRPSVDVLFRSMAVAAGASGVGVILTGMGDDGAAGLLEMRSCGAVTFGQDAASCVVYGMPNEARRRGAVGAEVPLHAMAAAILKSARGRRAPSGVA